MSEFYTRMQATADRLLTKFEQGTVVYTSPSTIGGTPTNPTAVAGTDYTVNATVRGVSAMYASDSLVEETDLMVVMPAFAVSPDLSGRVTIDGKEHTIVKIDRKPAAGTVVAWFVYVRA